MAVCEIWDVKGRLDHPIDYAENPEKTANPKYYLFYKLCK